MDTVRRNETHSKRCKTEVGKDGYSRRNKVLPFEEKTAPKKRQSSCAGVSCAKFVKYMPFLETNSDRVGAHLLLHRKGFLLLFPN